jgi:hypothetical protein
LIRKDVVIAVLATFCLTSTLFMITTSKSQSGVGEYNPWADYNGDGTIDIFDIVPVAVSFGATGDSTKNVTIAGHANKLAYSVEEQPVAAGGYFITPYISVDGYSKMTICTSWYSPPSSFNDYLLFAQHSNGSSPFGVDRQTNITDFVKTYDVPNQEIAIEFFNYGATQSYVWIDVYLIP